MWRCPLQSPLDGGSTVKDICGLSMVTCLCVQPYKVFTVEEGVLQQHEQTNYSRSFNNVKHAKLHHTKCVKDMHLVKLNKEP